MARLVGNRLKGIDDVETFARTTPVSHSDLDFVNTVAGTKIAQSEYYEMSVFLDCQMLGVANGLFYFYYGQPGTPGISLYDQSGNPISGAFVESVGNVMLETIGGASLTFRNTTPFVVGDPITFQLVPGIIGGTYQFKSIDSPFGIALTPDFKKLFISKYGSSSVQPFRLNPNGYNWIRDFGARPQCGVSIPTAPGPWKLMLGTDIGCVGSLFSQTVSWIDVVNEKWLRDSAIPSGVPFGVTFNPFSFFGWAPVTAYCCTSTGRMYPITTATGAVGTEVLVGAGTDALYDLVLNPTGTKAYVCNYTQSLVKPVTLPNTLGSNIAMGGQPVRIKRPPSMAVSGTAATNVFTTLYAHTLRVNDTIVFTDLSGGTGITAGAVYHVIASGLTDMDFKVSATQGGAELDFTTDVTCDMYRNKMWVMTEGGGPGGVAMMKSIDLATDTVTATYNLNHPMGNSFDIMTGGRVAFCVFDNGKFQQINLEGERAGLHPAGHTGSLGTFAGQVFTGSVAGCAIDIFDSIYYTLFEDDSIYCHPGGRVVFNVGNALAGLYGSGARVTFRSIS